MENLYEVLGLKPNATMDEIKKKYRALSKKFHPDRNLGDQKAEEQFKKINAANEILSDEVKRIVYDTSLKNSAINQSETNNVYSFNFSRSAVAIVIVLVITTIAMISFISSANNKT